MKIILNGLDTNISEETTISTLLESKNIKAEMVVIEINGKIIERRDFDNTNFINNDKLEILYFVGGG